MRNDAIETINERSINSPPKIILHPRSFNHESLKVKAFSDVAVIVIITYEGLDFTLYIYIINQMETTIPLHTLYRNFTLQLSRSTFHLPSS